MGTTSRHMRVVKHAILHDEELCKGIPDKLWTASTQRSEEQQRTVNQGTPNHT